MVALWMAHEELLATIFHVAPPLSFFFKFSLLKFFSVPSLLFFHFPFSLSLDCALGLGIIAILSVFKRQMKLKC